MENSSLPCWYREWWQVLCPQAADALDSGFGEGRDFAAFLALSAVGDDASGFAGFALVFDALQ